MTDLAQFTRFLEVHGTDPARWPPRDRVFAEHVLAADPAAKAVLERIANLDAVIARWRPSPLCDAQDPSLASAATERVMAALSRPLPPQRSRPLPAWWPAELLDWKFAPAWPRIGALAAMASLGFAVGLGALAFAASHWPDRPTDPWRRAHGADLISIMAESEPFSEIGL